MEKIKVLKDDLILYEGNYLQQVESVEIEDENNQNIYTCDSRFPYDLDDLDNIVEIWRKSNDVYKCVYKK